MGPIRPTRGGSQRWLVALLLASSWQAATWSQEKRPAVANPKEAPAPTTEPAGFPPPEKLVRLAKDYDIWIDPPKKQVVVDGKVVLREGQLEMFACPRQTKEHESIVAVNCKAQFIHAGLLAVGATPGKPVKYDPEYQPATGPEIEVWVHWKDEKGDHKVLAQEWIQHIQSGKPLQYPFVFAGSGFHVDEVTGQRHYLAEGGDLICVSNFSSALLDLPINSSPENAGLAFRAFTEKIPPVGTPVRLVLTPKAKPAAPAEKPPTDKKAAEKGK